jgi:hypothetical protein
MVQASKQNMRLVYLRNKPEQEGMGAWLKQ